MDSCFGIQMNCLRNWKKAEIYEINEISKSIKVKQIKATEQLKEIYAELMISHKRKLKNGKQKDSKEKVKKISGLKRNDQQKQSKDKQEQCSLRYVMKNAAI